MEYYSATKKKKVLASQRKETWKNLKRTLLSERDRYCVIPPTQHSGEGRSKARRKTNNSGCQGLQEEEGRDG